MSSVNRTVLYVSGFSPNLRARDLAYEFERYGRLIRCDIPALKTAQSSPFAFIEFRRDDDAEDAYYDMHGRSIDGRRIAVQWAKRPPSSQWRHDGGGPPAEHGSDRGPRPDGRDGRGRPDPRLAPGGWGDRRGGDRDYDDRRRSPPPRRSQSPVPSRGDDRRRSTSPRRDRDDRDVRDARRSPSPPREKERNGDEDGREERGEDDRERRDD